MTPSLSDLAKGLSGFFTGINPSHRFLIMRNIDRKFVGSTNDLGKRLPEGHRLIDTIGEDDLGPGIARTLQSHLRSKS